MNLRQKRKHYKYSYRYFIAYYSENTKEFVIHCPKKNIRKRSKENLKLTKIMITMNVVGSIGYTRNFTATCQNL